MVPVLSFHLAKLANPHFQRVVLGIVQLPLILETRNRLRQIRNVLSFNQVSNHVPSCPQKNTSSQLLFSRRQIYNCFCIATVHTHYYKYIYICTVYHYSILYSVSSIQYASLMNVLLQLEPKFQRVYLETISLQFESHSADTVHMNPASCSISQLFWLLAETVIWALRRAPNSLLISLRFFRWLEV